MTEDETIALEERVQDMAGPQGLELIKNTDGSYSLISPGELVRTIAGVTTLQEAYRFLKRKEQVKRLSDQSDPDPNS